MQTYNFIQKYRCLNRNWNLWAAMHPTKVYILLLSPQLSLSSQHVVFVFKISSFLSWILRQFVSSASATITYRAFTFSPEPSEPDKARTKATAFVLLLVFDQMQSCVQCKEMLLDWTSYFEHLFLKVLDLYKEKEMVLNWTNLLD